MYYTSILPLNKFRLSVVAAPLSGRLYMRCRSATKHLWTFIVLWLPSN